MALAHNIKQQIVTRAKDKNLSILNLERKAGLHRGAASNILDGKSSNPTIQTLLSIAKVLGCTVDELLSGTEFISIPPNQQSEDFELLVKLFCEVVETIIAKLDKDFPQISFNQILGIIKEGYTYCLMRKNKCIDKEFINWLVDNKVKRP
jgi:transcriptional regulator with XRE-family HTH domain